MANTVWADRSTSTQCSASCTPAGRIPGAAVFFCFTFLVGCGAVGGTRVGGNGLGEAVKVGVGVGVSLGVGEGSGVSVKVEVEVGVSVGVVLGVGEAVKVGSGVGVSLDFGLAEAIAVWLAETDWSKVA
jgi:hypothetical protein